MPVGKNMLVDAIGLACYIAYSYLFWDSPLLLHVPAADGLLLAQGILTCLSALVLVLLWGRVAPLRRNWGLLALFCGLEAGSVVLAAQGEASAGMGMAALGFMCSGAGSSMRLGWEERLSVRGVRATAIRAGLAYVIAAGIYALVVLTPYLVALTITAMLPVASLFALIFQEKLLPTEGLQVPDPAIAPLDVRASLRLCFERVPWRIPVFVGLSYFCFGASRMSSLSQSIGAGSSLGGLTVVIAMLACSTGIACAYVSHRHSVRAGIYAAVPAMAVAGVCSILGLPNAELVILFVANVGVEITKYIMLFLMIDVIIKDGAPAVLCLALLRFAQWGGSVLGQGVAGVLPQGEAVSVAMLLVLVVALLMVMGAFTGQAIQAPQMPQADSARLDGTARPSEQGDSKDTGDVPAPAAPVSPMERIAVDEPGLARRVAWAVDAYGLSPREGEVLEIWATGRSIEYVQKVLFISKSTVKTHLNHIYAKTGTDRREALLELLEAAPL